MNGTDPGPGKVVRPFHLWRRWMGVLGLLVLVAGCAAAPITIGYRAPLQNLDRLISEKSSAADVRAALGEPRGHGAARYTKDSPLRKVWYYEFTQLTVALRIPAGRHRDRLVGLNILLVFFRDDRYDGYLWFSAEELLTRQLS